MQTKLLVVNGVLLCTVGVGMLVLWRGSNSIGTRPSVLIEFNSILKTKRLQLKGSLSHSRLKVETQRDVHSEHFPYQYYADGNDVTLRGEVTEETNVDFSIAWPYHGKITIRYRISGERQNGWDFAEMEALYRYSKIENKWRFVSITPGKYSEGTKPVVTFEEMKKAFGESDPYDVSR